MLHDAARIDVAELIANKRVEAHFQPIVSVRRQAIIGIEALSRGFDAAGKIIAPLALFAAAAEQNLTDKLDDLCRETALRNFLPLHRRDANLILFLNLEAATFCSGGRAMSDLTKKIGIEPRNVAVEILEAEFDSQQQLSRLVSDFKDCGFLVAMDDIGVGHSNLERIFYVKPDILKADGFLSRNIHLEYHKQQIYKSLVHLSEKIGGWIITEGVESEHEAIAALELGGDIIQGYCFGRPYKIEKNTVDYNRKSLVSVGQMFKRRVVEKIKTDRSERAERTATTLSVAETLSRLPLAEMEDRLRILVKENTEIDSACILGGNGIQVSETVIGTQRIHNEKTKIFRPPPLGTDHSFKEYFYALKETNVTVFETKPYVPLPCGEICVTTSTFFNDRNGTELILCLHLNFDSAFPAFV